MKRLMTICLAAAMIAVFSQAAMADLDWKFVSFDSVIGGGFTYDASGDDVISNSNSAFKTAMGDTLSVQQIGGDGENNPVTGNFAFFAAMNYTDNDNVFGWAQNIATTPLAIEICAHTLVFSNKMEDYFALDARDMPNVDYLTASLAELGLWGCTELADDIWMDIAVDPINKRVAISIVMDQFFLQNAPDIDTYLEAGNLDGQTQSWRASGIYLAAVPEPATMVLLGIGGLLVRKFRKA